MRDAGGTVPSKLSNPLRILVKVVELVQFVLEVVQALFDSYEFVLPSLRLFLHLALRNVINSLVQKFLLLDFKRVHNISEDLLLSKRRVIVQEVRRVPPLGLVDDLLLNLLDYLLFSAMKLADHPGPVVLVVSKGLNICLGLL